MAEETKMTPETQEETKKAICAYTIYRYEDGSTEVKNVEEEGLEKLNTAQIFNDILVVAKQVKERKEEERLYNACVTALSDYMTAYANQKRAAEIEAQADANSSVEMPE